MTFMDIVDLKPKVRLCDFIQLWLLGYDDKIYIDLECDNPDGTHFEISEARIISEELIPYYEREIEFFEDTDYDSHSKLFIRLKDEEPIPEPSNVYEIRFSTNELYFKQAMITSTVEAKSATEAVEWFHEKYTNADKYYIHEVLKIERVW